MIARIIFLCFGILALILGALSLRDFFLARQGKTDKMILQLPLGIKQRIHKNIKERTAVGGVIIGSLLAGFFISFLEFGCTGQVYLPTITFMVSKAGFALQPVAALVAYNLMFILPLAVIALLATLFSTKNIAKSLESKIPVIKLATAFLFFGLGVLLIVSS
jgi:cytochrome c biogenesis protein CcdA